MAQFGDISGLPLLEVLVARDNAISSAQGLEGCLKLRAAHLDRNRCKKLAALELCPQLAHLRCDKTVNVICASIKADFILISLFVTHNLGFSLSANELFSIKAVKNLMALQFLDVSGNFLDVIGA